MLFDTAPTGHTIRLLQLPGSWTDFLAAGKGDASCLGPLAGLDKQKAMYVAAVAALADPERTRLVLVARPSRSALHEIDRTHTALAALPAPLAALPQDRLELEATNMVGLDALARLFDTDSADPGPGAGTARGTDGIPARPMRRCAP